MTKTFQDLIREKFPNLSPGQKKVAEFLIASLEQSSLYTISQIAREVGVSETTVIRLAYALGLSSFSEMQKMIRQDWLSQKQPTYSMTEEEEVEVTNIFSHSIEQEKKILDRLRNQIREEDIWRTAELLIRADRIYIGGFRETYTAAYWLFYKLNQLRDHIYVSSPTGYIPETLCNFGEKSVVLLMSLPRYSKEALILADQARKQGATLIAMTDRHLSPIGQLATITLTTGENTEIFSDHALPLLSLSQLIVMGMHQRDSKNIRERQEKMEQIYNHTGIFIE
ncbi:MurR/RpiR family transcriptional regulator [Brevibacillus invocatus]|uniref:MurR/RpiR family transcriptional regulator n=1 Tax=Brevibacillus invocatus TaxID=173959 RepID=A0A3M8BX32_9BACL|nr:MurR/RpiR family transcriptional regulator [Brevibacillus invocatus]